MTNELFPSAAPDFTDPLGLLLACHQRILSHCETLEKAIAHITEKGVDAEARKALGQVHRYFSTAARHHHQDEEEDLFPLLSRQSLKLADLVHRLRGDHKDMAAQWEALQPLLEKPDTIAEDQKTFAATVEGFNAAYRNHIKLEEAELLERAQHILSRAQLCDLGNRMAERRGQRPSYL